MLELHYTVLENGNLQFTCNDEYQKYLKDIVENWQWASVKLGSPFASDREEGKAMVLAFPFSNYIELERAVFANEEAIGWPFDWVEPHEIAALTAAPILAEVEGDDWTRIWWYPNYQINSPIDDLIAKGETVFDAAPENEEA